LRALGLGARMVDILERQIEFVFVVFWIAAIFRCRDPSEHGRACGDRRLAVIELGEGDLA
jgi:hypothetical protein